MTYVQFRAIFILMIGVLIEMVLARTWSPIEYIPGADPRWQYLAGYFLYSR